MDEKKLIQKAKAGDNKAFEELIEEHFKKIYNIAYRMTGNPDDASDMTQEVMIKLFRNIGSFKGDSKFSTWVYRVATNTCLDELKKQKRHSHTSLNAEFDTGEGELTYDVEDTAPTPEEATEKKELRHTVAAAIQKLSPDHKAAIILRDIKGFSYDEIAKVLKCSEGTVKSRLNRARAALKEILKKDFNFDGT